MAYTTMIKHEKHILLRDIQTELEFTLVLHTKNLLTQLVRKSMCRDSPSLSISRASRGQEWHSVDSIRSTATKVVGLITGGEITNWRGGEGRGGEGRGGEGGGEGREGRGGEGRGGEGRGGEERGGRRGGEGGVNVSKADAFAQSALCSSAT